MYLCLLKKKGSTFRKQILKALQDSTFFNESILPYSQTPKGSALYSLYLATATARYPEYIEELRGIADGAQTPFSKVILPWTVCLYTYNIYIEREREIACGCIVGISLYDDLISYARRFANTTVTIHFLRRFFLHRFFPCNT